MMESLWQTQRRSMACGLLSGVFLVTAVVLSRRISGDASAFSSELAACLTGIVTSLVAILAALVPNLINDRLLRPQRTLLVSVCGIPGVMLGLSVMPSGTSTGLACLLGLYLAAVLTVSALDIERVLPTACSENRSTVEPVKKSDDAAVVLSDAGPSSAIGGDELNAFAEPFFEQPAPERSLEERLLMRAGDAHSGEDRRESVSITPAVLTERDVLTEAAALSDTTVSAEATALPFDLHEPMPHPGSNPETTQWMSRSTVEGLDVAEGAFRVRFAAGQRLTPVHLPFSPPLADTPEFECESADGSDLRFRTTAMHSYGIRIEVSRSADCDQEAIAEVAWMASAPLNESVAA